MVWTRRGQIQTILTHPHVNITLVVVTSSLNSTRCMCNNLLPSSSPRRDASKRNAETRQLLIEEDRARHATRPAGIKIRTLLRRSTGSHPVSREFLIRPGRVWPHPSNWERVSRRHHSAAHLSDHDEPTRTQKKKVWSRYKKIVHGSEFSRHNNGTKINLINSKVWKKIFIIKIK